MPAQRPYAKKPLSIQEQIGQLKSRGMNFDDEARAEAILSRVSYSRLRPYWHPFEVNNASHKFRGETTFEEVWALYEFDRTLRLLALEALERFEVALRTQWAHQMASAHGPFGYLEKKHYRDAQHFEKDLGRLREEWNRPTKDDPIFEHFKNSYQEPLPPVWLACEAMSLGNLSKWYGNLNDRVVSQNIARLFGLPDRYLKNATRHLVSVRNHAAHHARLWDRVFSVYPLPRLHKNPGNLAESLEPSPQPQKIYRSLTLLRYLMVRLDPHNDWPARLTALLHANAAYLDRMGFPADYARRPLW